MGYRIYILNDRLLFLVILVALISFVPFGAAVATAVLGLTTPGGLVALNAKLHAAIVIGIVFTASLDIIIATTLVVLLRKYGNQMYQPKRTNKMISILTIYLVGNNLLTSFITVSVLIGFFAGTNTLAYEALNVVISKAYTNTFLSQLNARQSIRGRGFITSSTHGHDSGPVARNIEPIIFNLGPVTGTNAEVDSESANPAIFFHSDVAVQGPSIGKISKKSRSSLLLSPLRLSSNSPKLQNEPATQT